MPTSRVCDNGNARQKKMSIIEDPPVNEDSYGEGGIHDDTAHEACYLYVPRTADKDSDQRPSKRRKIGHSAPDIEATADQFPGLLNGHEDVENAKRRQTTFRKCWREIQSRVAHLLEPVDSGVLDEIVQFVKDAPAASDQERLPTGLISCGPKAGSQTSLLQQWRSTQSQMETALVVSLHSAQATNLTTTLKNLIRAAIIQLDGADGYQMFLNERKRRIHMNYDLELLHDLVTSRKVERCAVYLTDIETFNMDLLTDLISVISAWKDRIPFVLLLGMSTTVDLFEARLPKSTIRLLDCKFFDASTRVDRCLEIYRGLHSQCDRLTLSFGPVVSGIMFEMSREQDASAASFSRAMQYAIMSHFFANALSILLDPDAEDMRSKREICEAIRSSDSFRAHAERKLKEGDAKTVRILLSDDKALFSTAKEAVQTGQEAMARHHAAVELFDIILNLITPSESPPDPFSIQVQALTGPPFLDSPIFTDLVSKIPTLPSDRMLNLLNTIQRHQNLPPSLDISTPLNKLNQLAPAATTNAPLRTAHDPTHPTTTTTITHNKISLSKHSPKLSAQESQYTRLADQITDTLASYFKSNIRNPTSLFMHEAFIYDLKSPLASVFTPRPRFATERALATPADYLGCECCEEGNGVGPGVASQRPPTSVLWQLWCEGGGVVNVRDLWAAFEAIVVERVEEEEEAGARGGQDEGEAASGGIEAAQVTGGVVVVDERMALALFYRGLAELRMMGFVKATKRKADCLAKTAWRGL